MINIFFINYVYKKLTGRINEKEEKKIKRINNLYSEMDDYYHRNKLIRLIILKNEGIIGMNDFIIDGKYFCRGIVKSVYCDLFCIEKLFDFTKFNIVLNIEPPPTIV